MDTTLMILIAAVVVAVIAIGISVATRRRSGRLQTRFGPEYERAVGEHDSRLKAERELVGLEKRRSKLDIRPLTSAEHERFSRGWAQAQTNFVDDPSGAIAAADGLVQDAMRTRGYPIDDFEQRASDISVDHPGVVENYRAAHAISLAGQHGRASTEDLRQGMVHYRALFAELLETPASTSSGGHVVVLGEENDITSR